MTLFFFVFLLEIYSIFSLLFDPYHLLGPSFLYNFTGMTFCSFFLANILVFLFSLIRMILFPFHVIVSPSIFSFFLPVILCSLLFNLYKLCAFRFRKVYVAIVARLKSHRKKLSTRVVINMRHTHARPHTHL